jgi:hypothetical protein
MTRNIKVTDEILFFRTKVTGSQTGFNEGSGKPLNEWSNLSSYRMGHDEPIPTKGENYASEMNEAKRGGKIF